MAGRTKANVARRLVTVAVVGALISPAVRNNDGLPLSTYPMYAGTRSNLSSYVTAIGVTEVGEPLTLSTTIIAGTMDWLIAQSYLNDAIARGEAGTVCAEIAGRSGGDVRSIEIATEQHDTVARMLGEESLLDRTVHATCRVRR